jgi:hypothetical protein
MLQRRYPPSLLRIFSSSKLLLEGLDNDLTWRHTCVGDGKAVELQLQSASHACCLQVPFNLLAFL